MDDIKMKKKSGHISIQTIGKWIENKYIIVTIIDSSKSIKRKIYFDGHDLYFTYKNARYYYSEFDIEE